MSSLTVRVTITFASSVVVRIVGGQSLEAAMDPQVLRGHAPHLRFDQLVEALAHRAAGSSVGKSVQHRAG